MYFQSTQQMKIIQVIVLIFMKLLKCIIQWSQIAEVASQFFKAGWFPKFVIRQGRIGTNFSSELTDVHPEFCTYSLHKLVGVERRDFLYQSHAKIRFRAGETSGNLRTGSLLRYILLLSFTNNGRGRQRAQKELFQHCFQVEKFEYLSRGTIE